MTAVGNSGLPDRFAISRCSGVSTVSRLCVDDSLAEREPALAQLAATAVFGLAPAGAELRRRPVELACRCEPSSVPPGAASFLLASPCTHIYESCVFG